MNPSNQGVIIEILYALMHQQGLPCSVQVGMGLCAVLPSLPQPLSAWIAAH